MLTSLGLRRIKLVGLLCVVGLVGCDREAMVRRHAPQRAKAEAEGYFQQLRDGQMDELVGELDTSLGGPEEIRETLARMATLFPQGAPRSVKLVDFSQEQTMDVETSRMTLEYEYPHEWLVGVVTTQKRDEFTAVTEFDLRQVDAPLESVNRFTLEGKGVAHFAMLVVWVVALLVQGYAFYECVRMKMRELKWFWLIFIPIGVGRLGFNWTTNESSFRWLSAQIPASMAWAAPYGPWILSVSLPLGAIVFLAKRRSFAASGAGGVGDGRAEAEDPA